MLLKTGMHPSVLNTKYCCDVLGARLRGCCQIGHKKVENVA